jgi:hypothetical protein
MPRQGDIPMNTMYLLPCSCGHKIPIQPRQAGEIVVCACGASLEVPTLLRLKALEKIEAPPDLKTTKSAWGAGHRLIFLGVIIILAAVGIGIWLFQIRPNDPFANFTPEQIVTSVENVAPVYTWRLWHAWEQGGLQRQKTSLQIAITGQKTQYRIYWWLLGILAGAGIAAIASGIVVISRSRATR